MLRRPVRGRTRNGHQPAQTQPRQPRDLSRECRRVVWRHTRLARLATDIHLQADVQDAPLFRPGGRQTLGDEQAVDAVHPVEMHRNRCGLVALHRANEMPYQWQVGQAGHFLQRLLHIALAEVPLPGCSQGSHRICRHRLADGQQGNRPGRAAGTRRSIGDALMDRLQCAFHCVHNTRHNQREPKMEISDLLAFAVKNKASDLHLSAGLPPMIRVNGDIRRINLPDMSHQVVHEMVYDIMNDGQRKVYEEQLEVDFSFEVPTLARFRVNAFNQNRGAGAVFRTIPSKVLTLEDLNAPKIFKEIANQPRGIVLVTGPTGSGKSTTLAAMVDFVNESEYGHILTVEDPIEFVHQSKKCVINQREVGPHTHSFSNALRSALREDPDVILIGEMRDLETIRLALTAAETGHLVFGTLHTSSAAKTIDRIVDVFPAAEKEMVRSMLSESIRAVISQTLLKTKDGTGRVAAHEIMIGTPAIRNLIRENKVAQMYSSIQTGQNVGMQTLDQCLQDLVKRNLVSPAEARLRAANKDSILG